MSTSKEVLGVRSIPAATPDTGVAEGTDVGTDVGTDGPPGGLLNSIRAGGEDGAEGGSVLTEAEGGGTTG
jgi:hypothetical protein